MIRETVLTLLEQKYIEYKLDYNVSKKSSFKIGGNVDLAIFPSDVGQLIETIQLLVKSDIKFEIIGNASNILFAFDTYHGAFIFTELLSSISIEDNKIICGAGVSLTHLANVAAKNSLSGLEFAFGIPALVGGAVYMNAGAYGSQLSDVIEYTVAYDTQKDITYKMYDNGFGYRSSCYERSANLICLGASFILKKEDPLKINEKMAQNMASRREKQPLEFPSAGSYFKRPDGHFAGKLIEDCELKGLCIGGAEVSKKHAGFIINTGNASYTDVLSLEEKIKERVYEAFGVALEREVKVISD